MPRSRGGGLSFEDDGHGFSRPQPVAPPTRRRRSWLTSGGGSTPSLSGERGGDSHAGTSGSVSEGSEGAPPAAPPPKKRRRPGADATAAMALASRLEMPGQQLLRSAGPLTGSTAFDGITGVDGVSQLHDEDLPMPRPLTTGLFPEAAGIGKRQASLSGWLPDRARSSLIAHGAACICKPACGIGTGSCCCQDTDTVRASAVHHQVCTLDEMNAAHGLPRLRLSVLALRGRAVIFIEPLGNCFISMQRRRLTWQLRRRPLLPASTSTTRPSVRAGWRAWRCISTTHSTRVRRRVRRTAAECAAPAAGRRRLAEG